MRYKITLMYDGAGFSGWQAQDGQTTVQGVLENAFQTVLRHPVQVIGSGRTDAGVHALGQVAHIDVPERLTQYRMRQAINAVVRPHLVVMTRFQKVPDDFHARFSAKQRQYIYRIHNMPYPPVLTKGRVWHVPKKLDVKAMKQAAAFLIGKHDFSAFRAADCQASSPVKTLDDVQIQRRGEEVIFTFKARSFLYHQVRNMVGSLVYVGLKKWTPAQFKTIFEGCDRTKAGPTAPAEGLYFSKVVF